MARINPKLLPPISPETALRFWSWVSQQPVSECWPWKGARDKDVYGVFGIRGTGNCRSSRIAYFLHYEVDPGYYLVCHSCDNPPCCNPAHLFLATHNDNMQDKIAKGRDARGDRQGKRLHPERWPIGDEHHARKHPECLARGIRHGRAKLGEGDVRAIRDYKGLANGRQLAAQYHVTPTTICAIRKRKIWKHL